MKLMHLRVVLIINMNNDDDNNNNNNIMQQRRLQQQQQSKKNRPIEREEKVPNRTITSCSIDEKKNKIEYTSFDNDKQFRR